MNSEIAAGLELLQALIRARIAETRVAELEKEVTELRAAKEDGDANN